MFDVVRKRNLKRQRGKPTLGYAQARFSLQEVMRRSSEGRGE